MCSLMFENSNLCMSKADTWIKENCSGRAGMKELVLFIIAKKNPKKPNKNPTNPGM